MIHTFVGLHLCTCTLKHWYFLSVRTIDLLQRQLANMGGPALSGTVQESDGNQVGFEQVLKLFMNLLVFLMVK